MKTNPLVKFGNVPVQIGSIAACFDCLSLPNEKIRALEKDGQLIRLKRGLYVVSSEVSGEPVNACLCANHIYGPSYVSLQYALRYYGLIPEQVFTVTSMTMKHSMVFYTPLARFDYVWSLRTFCEEMLAWNWSLAIYKEECSQCFLSRSDALMPLAKCPKSPGLVCLLP